jgi:hypothetical protein
MEDTNVRTYRRPPGAPAPDPVEYRHVRYSPPNATRDDFNDWLNRIPGRLFSLTPYPGNAHVWMAVSIEEVQ